jgi:FemAB-related protein (PEP-CTERM system-associated)
VIVIEVNPKISIEKWNEYVNNNPKGQFCHLPIWKSVIEGSFGHKPFYFFAKDEQKNIRGILPLFLVNSPLTGKRLVSLPFSSGGPIADSQEILTNLVYASTNLCDKLRCRYLELRTNESIQTQLNVNSYFSTYLLELSDTQELWKNLDSKSVRWAITKAQKDGVKIRESSNIKDLKYYYEVNLKTKKRLGVPGHPYSFLNNIFSRATDFTKLYIAEIEDRPIAGIICISYKDTVEYAYAASDSRYLKYHPNNLLVWQSIIDSCAKGYRFFDFGRTSPDDEGLCRFKKHWGTTQKTLYYYYYPKIPDLMALNRKGTKYRFITGLWQKLPFRLLDI